MTIAQRALRRDELNRLLVGSPEYRYLPRWTSAPGDTDLVALLEAIYGQTSETEREHVREAMAVALDSIVGSYEGIEPVATVILFESSRQMERRSPLGLPLQSVAGKLHRTISLFAERLESDQSGMGAGLQQGRLEDLRRLSRIAVEKGGPSFCP